MGLTLRALGRNGDAVQELKLRWVYDKYYNFRNIGINLSSFRATQIIVVFF